MFSFRTWTIKALYIFTFFVTLYAMSFPPSLYALPVLPSVYTCFLGRLVIVSYCLSWASICPQGVKFSKLSFFCTSPRNISYVFLAISKKIPLCFRFVPHSLSLLFEHSSGGIVIFSSQQKKKALSFKKNLLNWKYFGKYEFLPKTSRLMQDLFLKRI